MPIEVESASQVEEFSRVLRKRAWWILVPLVLFASLGTTYGVLVPKKYVSRTRVMVRPVFGRDGKPMRGQASGKVAAHLIRSRPRVQAAIQELKWEWQFLTRMEQEDLKDHILDDLTVKTPSMGLGVAEQIVEISYANTDRQKAFELVKLISERWQKGVLDSYRTARQDGFNMLQEQRARMDQRLDEIGLEVAELMKLHGIPPWNTALPGAEQPLAPEFEDLVGYRERAQELELEIMNGTRALESKQNRYDRQADREPQTTAIAGTTHAEEIAKIEEEIAKLKLKFVIAGWKPAHSKWALYQAQLRAHEVEKLALEDSQTLVEVSQTLVLNKQKLKLGQEIEEELLALEAMQAELASLQALISNTEYKAKELVDVYQALANLNNERDRTNENLIELENRVNTEKSEIRELMSAAGDPFTVLEDPGLPTRPTEPDPLLIVLFSIVAGLALGLGLAVVREYGRNCFRNVNDITRIMVVPVLGTVNAIVTASQRRRVLVVRALIGGATLVVVLTLGYITWAWSGHQELLSDGMRDNIERFRRSFE